MSGHIKSPREKTRSAILFRDNRNCAEAKLEDAFMDRLKELPLAERDFGQICATLNAYAFTNEQRLFLLLMAVAPDESPPPKEEIDG